MCFWRRKKKKKEEKPVVKEEKQPVTEKKEEPVKEKPKAVEPKVEKEEPVEEKEVKDIYHISQNKSEKSPHFKKWRVRKANSRKTIQYFNTQAEAIDFAKDLADKIGGSIVIHKRDGTIRKQDYSK